MKIRFCDCFNIYNILMDKEMSQNFKQIKICGMTNFVNFQFMNFQSFVNTWYCVVQVAIITLFSFVTFIHSWTHTHTHRDTHTDIHTHIHTHMQNSSFFNENIRSNKKMKIERNKLKYLHYLNKMIEKCKMKKFIFSEVSCF